MRTAVSEGNVWELGRALFSITADGDFLFFVFEFLKFLGTYEFCGSWPLEFRQGS